MRIHRALMKAKKTWLQMFKFLAIEPPEQWDEPGSEEDVRAQASWVTRDDAARMEKRLEPARKPAPKGV